MIDVCNDRRSKDAPICSAWGLAKKGVMLLPGTKRRPAAAHPHPPARGGGCLFKWTLLPAGHLQGQAEGTLDQQVVPIKNCLRCCHVQSEALPWDWPSSSKQHTCPTLSGNQGAPSGPEPFTAWVCSQAQRKARTWLQGMGMSSSAHLGCSGDAP